MRNFWLLARHEYRKLVGKRSFLVGTLGIPFLLMLVMGVSILVTLRADRDLPLGYVDHAGVIDPAVQPVVAEGDELLVLRPFPDQTAAQQALADREIQAFFVIPADYRQTLQLDLFYWQDNPGQELYSDFNAYMRASLAQSYPAAIQSRLTNQPDLTVRSADGSREFSQQSAFNFFIPFIAAFFFLFVVMGSSGYLLQVVTDEKENRTVEIMMTTVSPAQLIGGKALGLLAVSFTQVFIWIMTGLAAVFIGAQFFDFLGAISIPWSMVVVVVLFFIPAYALIAGMMTAIGSATTEVQQAQQIAGILNLLFVLPFFFIALIFTNPSSPILLFLTFFPTTSFITVMMRWGMSTVPLWQVGLSWGILVGTAVAAIWFASRIFRLGMLRYGQSLSLRDTLTAVRQRS